MSRELVKIQENNTKELNGIRETGKEVYERENHLLRESRDASVKALELAQDRLRMLQASNEDQVIGTL